MLRLIRKEDVLARIFPHFDFNIEENVARRKWEYDDPKFDCADWTPEGAKKRSVSRWSCKNRSLIKSLCNLPEVLGITDINEIALLRVESELLPKRSWAMRRSKTNGPHNAVPGIWHLGVKDRKFERKRPKKKYDSSRGAVKKPEKWSRGAVKEEAHT